MTYQVVDNKVVNDKGEVAVAYYTTIQHMVRVAKTDYVFVPQHHVCLSWIKPEHVDAILQMVHRCCGGNNSTPAYRLENISNTRVWTGDAER